MLWFLYYLSNYWLFKDNNCDIKSLEIINDVDKNTVLQKFSNFNRFITDDKMIHQVSDNKVFSFYWDYKSW